MDTHMVLDLDMLVLDMLDLAMLDLAMPVFMEESMPPMLLSDMLLLPPSWSNSLFQRWNLH